MKQKDSERKKSYPQNLTSQIQPAESDSLLYLCSEPENDFAAIKECKHNLYWFVVNR